MALVYTQLATDNFTRANETPLSGGGVWLSPSNGGAQINLVSNNAQSTSIANESRANYQGLTWPADQYSQVTVGAGFISTTFMDPTVRCTTSAGVNTMYRLIVNPTTWTLVANVANVGITIAAGNLVFAVGDVVRLEVIGTTLICKKNGIIFNAQIDTRTATGRAGISMFDTVTAANAKSPLWAAGSITGTYTNPVFVQSTHNPSADTSGVLAYTSNNVAGNTLVCVFRKTGLVGNPALPPIATLITDSQANNWQILSDTVHLTSRFGIAVAFNCKAGANTVTINAANFWQFVISEYSGVQSFDRVITNTAGANSAAWTVGPLTPSSSVNLAIGMITNETANSLTIASSTIGGGFINRDSSTGNLFHFDNAQVGSANADTVSATYSSSVAWAGALALFNGAGNPNSLMMMGAGT